MTDKKMKTPEQMVLFTDQQVEITLEASERAAGVFSGEALRKSDPEKHRVIIELLADDSLSIRLIAKLTKASRNLVTAMRRDNQSEIEPLKKRMAGDFFMLSRLCTERAIKMLNDDTAQIRLGELAVASGINFDKGQLASGEPTSIHGDSKTERTAGDVIDELAAMKRRQLERTRSEADNPKPKAIPAADIEVGPAARISESEDTDSESGA